jgi:hypothetical protein
MLTVWWIDATTNVEYVIFYFQGQWYHLFHSMCTRDAWVATIERVKEQCLVAAASLIEKLALRFPNQEFMNGIGRLYMDLSIG